ncbi:MAG TPA: HAD family hydrolase [Pseudolysinimonas sp.]|jgi:putative hydrolase of the HAD superfamily
MALPNPPRAVLLDLDETLIDGSGLATSTVAVSAAFAARHPELGLDPMVLAQANGVAWQSSWTEHEPKWIRGELDDLGLSTAVWTAALGELGVADPERYASEAAHEHVAALAAATRPYDDVLPALDALAVAGIPLGVVTNGSSSAQRGKIALIGAERFAVVAVTGEHGVAKPDPRIFGIALEELGLPAGDVVHVGDSLRADVAGAQAAGIATVWLNRTGEVRPADAATPDAQITTLAQLPAVLGLG